MATVRVRERSPPGPHDFVQELHAPQASIMHVSKLLWSMELRAGGGPDFVVSMDGRAVPLAVDGAAAAVVVVVAVAVVVVVLAVVVVVAGVGLPVR